MINSVVLVGRITKELELKYSSSGVAHTNGTLAVNRQKSETDFISFAAFNKTAETMANYLQKGALIGIEGRIQTGSYERDGGRVYTTDVIVDRFTFLESKKDSQGRRIDLNENPFQEQGGCYDITDNDLPF